MSKIKSFLVGSGDIYTIRHGSNNFTVIDCNPVDERREEIVDEIICKPEGDGECGSAGIS